MDSKREKNASEGIAPMGITAINETVLSDQPESRYECPVCLNWLREPVITTCGHRFCKSCITSWLQNSGHCPIDNVNLTMKVDIFPDNFTRREIQEQRMSCPFSTKGCTAKVAPLELDSHIATCQFNQPERSVETTRVPCSFRALGCQYSAESQDRVNEHLQEAMQTHMTYLVNAYSELRLNNDLSSASEDAKEQEALCLWEAPDKAGQSTCPPPIKNTSALIRALYERVVILEQRNREQDIVIANLSKQVSAFGMAKRKQTDDMILRYCMGNYIWKIDNFKAKLDDMLKNHSKMLYSPGFYTSPNGYVGVVALINTNFCYGTHLNDPHEGTPLIKFCIRLNISPQNPLCFALHLHLIKTEHDDCLEWPFNGRISLAMVNQYDADLTQRDTMMSNTNLIAFRRPTAEFCLRGFGYSEYAVVSDVVRNGFVKDDVLVIRVLVKCV